MRCEVCHNTIPDEGAACVFHVEGCRFDGGFADQCCCEGFCHRRCCRSCREPVRAVRNARAV